MSGNDEVHIKFEEFGEAIIEAIENHSEKSRRHCLKCVNWDNSKEICQKFGQRPPLAVIVAGCHEYDIIPF